MGRQDRQRNLAAAIGERPVPFLRRQDGLGVFPNLFRTFEELVVTRVIIIFAVVRAILPTDRRTVFVNVAQRVRCQVLAVSVDQQVPRIVLDENCTVSVQQIPPQMLEVFNLCGRVDGKREIAATLGRTMLAEHFAGFEFLTRDLVSSHWCV